ncbi:MAG: hypothetical protein AAF492_24010, partial [Verrucomicrobiota bacterium]
MKRKRKRTVPDRRNEHEFSGRLRQARDALQQTGRRDEGLRLLNEALEMYDGPAERVRILGLIGHYEQRRNHPAEAARAYRRAIELLGDEPRDFCRQIAGLIECYLREGDFDLADRQAEALLDYLKEYRKSFRQVVRNANRRIARDGVAVIPERPVKIHVAAQKIARKFLARGDARTALKYLKIATRASPSGAAPARVTLAAMNLNQGEWTSALFWAESAIEMSGLRANNIEAWPVIVRARQQLGKSGLEEKHLGWLERASAGSVRARVYVELIKALQRHNDPDCHDIAIKWLQEEGDRFPIEAVEVLKNILSDAVRRERPAEDIEKLARTLVQ